MVENLDGREAVLKDLQLVISWVATMVVWMEMMLVVLMDISTVAD